MLQKSASGKKLWIGVRDEITEGVWRLEDGSPIDEAASNVFSWAIDQPDQGTAANCANVWPNGLMHDGPCDERMVFTMDCVKFL